MRKLIAVFVSFVLSFLVFTPTPAGAQIANIVGTSYSINPVLNLCLEFRLSSNLTYDVAFYRNSQNSYTATFRNGKIQSVNVEVRFFQLSKKGLCDPFKPYVGVSNTTISVQFDTGCRRFTKDWTINLGREPSISFGLGEDCSKVEYGSKGYGSLKPSQDPSPFRGNIDPKAKNYVTFYNSNPLNIPSKSQTLNSLSAKPKEPFLCFNANIQAIVQFLNRGPADLRPELTQTCIRPLWPLPHMMPQIGQWSVWKN